MIFRYISIMKLIVSIAISLLFIMPFAAYSQQDASLDAALNKGSAIDVGVFFAGTVDVSIPGTETSMSSADAIQTLTQFFANNLVKGYNRAHLTAPQAGRAAYSLGDLYTSGGTYRIYLYFNDQKKISEIRIQK